MKKEKNNNNLIYASLVIAGLLLLLIPFFMYDIGIGTLEHFGRFGLHVLAFVAAIFAGSIFSVAASNATATVSAVKATAIVASVVVTGSVVYNSVQQKQVKKEVAEITFKKDSISNISLIVSQDSINLDTDSSSIAIATSDTIIEVNEENIKSKVDNSVIIENSTINNTTVESTPKKVVPDDSKIKAPIKEERILDASCNDFQLLHGSKQLDRKLGLSIYDPDKTIRFSNECGCIVKDANLILYRENQIVEQKTQSGNLVSLRSFKDVQVGDRLEVIIKDGACKNSKGITVVYTFPKSLLMKIFISDHREFETASEIKNRKAPKELMDNSKVKEIPKDKVEEELNKYGN